MKNKYYLLLIVLLPVFIILAYQTPFIKSRLEWRVMEWRATIKYLLSPPEQVIFQPGKEVEPSAIASNAKPQRVLSLTSTPTPFNPTITPLATTLVPSSSTITPTSLPLSFKLTGIRYERQGWNNCGPATLAMALSFWGWEGDQYAITPFTKPNSQDKNVMPYEMTDYVNNETVYRAITRMAGDLQLLKLLIASGFPVIIEKGFEGDGFTGWMGHYELMTGYDETTKLFTVQDSYMGGDLQIPYSTIESYWRAFNGTYIILFPYDLQSKVSELLGPQFDEIYNRRYAAQKASAELDQLSGRDKYFALFNLGTSLVALLEYSDAATAYDNAFAVYITVSEKDRPWRMMWYQTGPYWAYYYTGRFQDVINLATSTLENMSDPVLEESYYWRGQAYEAVGNLEKAIQDYRMSVAVHPGFQPSIDRLAILDVEVNSP